MSIFDEVLSKINVITNDIADHFKEDVQAAIQRLEKFEEEYLNAKKARDKLQKKNTITTLQSIHEDDDESTKALNDKAKNNSDESETSEKRNSKKRNKNEVDDLLSPELEKRQKRNASVKAQGIISKQVNVNLTQKLRRDESEKKKKDKRSDDDKENTEPLIVKIKQEKISIPPEAIDFETIPLKLEMNQEDNKDKAVMPPPAAPVPKPRRAVPKSQQEVSEEEDTGRRRTTRTRKQTDVLTERPSSRSTRASSRNSSRHKGTENEEPVVTEARPKRTRNKKAAPNSSNTDSEKQTDNSGPSSRSTRASSRASSRNKGTENEEPVVTEARPKRTRNKRAAPNSSNTDSEKQTDNSASPAEKPRPKRTRKGKAKDKEQNEDRTDVTDKPEEIKTHENVTEPLISPKKEISDTPLSSPILNLKHTKNINGKIEPINIESNFAEDKLESTTVLPNPDVTVTLSNDMDKTIVLPNGIYNHNPVTPKALPQMNETVVLDNNRGTMVIDKQPATMDTTVVLDKGAKVVDVTDDNSLLTDDNDSKHNTPDKQPVQQQPLSAVKEKVQLFEEMGTRVTRTKTRAMAKKDDPSENHTPPDKVSKAILSAETLTKMNSMIFKEKQPQISSSASKIRDTGLKQPKNYVTSSASKISAYRSRELEEQRREKEDARRKKESLLEAKREMQKRKREEKMAAAAAARSAAEKERRAALEAAARDRQEKQAHADLGRQERLKEAERKKIELARKVAETEERRRAEEHARQQRLAEEQRRAEAARKKQLEEAESMKKEAAMMAKEIERRQREFLEKQKKKQKMEGGMTPLKTPGTPCGYPMPIIEPKYMADGFEYLNSDEEAEPVERPVPAWSMTKVRKQQLLVQTRIPSELVDRLFSVRAHTPDLREIFPGIERARLKRTSSAVWRTPPARLHALPE